MSVPENRNSFASKVRRGTLLRLASETLGQEALADGLGISTRALRMKLGMDRPIANADLTRARELLLLHVQSTMALAADLSAAAGPQPIGAIVTGVVAL